jgi:hypothetical protein
VYPLSKLDTCPPLTSVVAQDLDLQEGASRLQTTSANLWTFLTNITSPLRTHFALFNPTGLCHYHVILIILLPKIKF